MCVCIFSSCCMHALNVAINQVAFATAAASVVVLTAAYVFVVVRVCCCCLLFTLCQQGQRRLLHVAQQAKNWEEPTETSYQFCGWQANKVNLLVKFAPHPQGHSSSTCSAPASPPSTSTSSFLLGVKCFRTDNTRKPIDNTEEKWQTTKPKIR